MLMFMRIKLEQKPCLLSKLAIKALEFGNDRAKAIGFTIRSSLYTLHNLSGNSNIKALH